MSSTTTDYAGNFIYENNVLQFFSHSEGYIEPSGSNFNYVYQYKDHLGNIRLSYKDLDNNGSITPSTEILKERNYYPFGLEHSGYNNVVIGTENNHKTFQGQELNKELGLNWLSFKYRNYDPAIARFMSVDPLASKYPYNGVYNFSENRVIDGVELEGLEFVHYEAKDLGDGGTHNMKSKKPNEYSTWVSKALSKVGINIEPFKIYVLNYKGNGYLFKEDEYEKMLVAQPKDFTHGRPTIGAVHSIQLIMSALAKFTPTPSSAKSNEVIDVAAEAIEKAKEFKEGVTNNDQIDKKKHELCSDCERDKKAKQIDKHNSDSARLFDNDYIKFDKFMNYRNYNIKINENNKQHQ